MIKITNLIAVLFIASASFSYAADTTPSSSGPAWLTEAQKEMKAKNYDGAIKTLLAANEPNSADWNNLLGFAQRKKSPADLNAAEFYYQAALKIDPKH
jgi:tetratricopeptide (TPR) repeat protein